MARLPRVEVERVDRAKLALQAFRTLQPTLTAYAQMLTGRPDVKVVAAAHDNGSTDGGNIYYRPPIELGDRIPHQRWYCDKRDEDGHLLCPACEQRESVLATIYHEIAHIWFKSFDKVSDKHRRETMLESVKIFGDDYAKAIAERIEKLPRDVVGSGYMVMAGEVSEFLPTIVNALEDARVNRELFRSLPGTKVMFDASTRRIFAEGVEQQDTDGEWKKIQWRDYKLNAQIICAIFCAASGYNYEGWFHEKVIESMADEELSALVAKCDLTYSMGEVYSLSFPILHRLRELGYCISEKDPMPPMPSDEGEPGEEERSGGEGEGSDEAGSSGSDSSGEDDSPGGDKAGESASSPEMDSTGESPGADGTSPDGTGKVDREEAEGSAEADPPAGGDAGREGGDTDLCDASGEDRRGHDSPRDDDLAKDDRGAPEAGAGDSGEAADESSSESTAHEGTGDIGGDSTDVRDAGRLDRTKVDSGSGDAAGTEDVGEPDASPDGDEDGLVDTGSFDRGTRAVTDGDYVPPKPAPPLGTSDDVKVAVHKLGDHEERPYSAEMKIEAEKDAAAMKVAIVQGVYFEMPSVDVYGITEYKFPAGPAWRASGGSAHRAARMFGVTGDFDPTETILGPALLRARVVFADNQRARYERNLKAGKVSTRHLGRRAPVGDDRLMQRKILPGKKSYFVLIAIDVSASTAGRNITLAKQVAMAEAELLSRLGIAFAVYAHSGGSAPESSAMYQLHMYKVKGAEEPWNEATRVRVRSLGPDSANLDGHSLEFYRKILDTRSETNKILHYYSDGAMPCENFAEELAILKREIQKCRRSRYTLLGVGIRTNAPKQHGLETVEVHQQGDIVKVIDHLQKNLIL